MFQEIYIERTECFGACPVYTKTVDGEGYVTFNGKTNNVMNGVFKWKLSFDEMKKLRRLFKKFDYLNYGNDAPDEQVVLMATDYPSCVTRVVFEDGTERTIDHYLGELNINQTLTWFEKRLDIIIGDPLRVPMYG